MSEEQSKTSKAEGDTNRSSRDKWIKLAFALTALVVIILVYFNQKKPATVPEGWSRDLPAALAKAKAEDRRVLVIFDSSPPSQTAKQMLNITLNRSQNTEAIEKGGFIPVMVDYSPQLGEEYILRVEDLPVTLILDPNGVELNRRTGYIGEVPFREGFLTLKEIQKPK